MYERIWMNMGAQSGSSAHQVTGWTNARDILSFVKDFERDGYVIIREFYRQDPRKDRLNPHDGPVRYEWVGPLCINWLHAGKMREIEASESRKIKEQLQPNEGR